MERNFTVTGTEALLAIAACERTTTLTGQSETKPGTNVTIAYGAVGRLFPVDKGAFAWNDAPDGNLTVEVQRVMTKPGVYRYHCTVQPDPSGVLS
jgi:hypothetical protein